MRGTLPIAVALSVLLVATVPAQAERIANTQSYGPIALAGNAVVYVVHSSADQGLHVRARLRLARPGQQSRLIFSQRLARGFSDEPTVSVPAASSRRVGLILEQDRGDPESNDFGTFRELWTGRPTGPLKRVSTTRRRANPCLGGPLAVAVGDDALVTVDGTCSSQRVVVRDYARRGTPRIIARAQRIKALAATGHFVAWVQRTRRTERPHWTYTIVVYDRSRNRVAYRIPNSGWPDHLSVQADGKIAGQGEGGTAWYSAAEQTRHVLPAGSVEPPRLGADKLLFSGNFGPTGETSLALRDLSGSQTVVASFPARQFRPSFHNADFDGRHLAFLQVGCATNELWMQDATGPAYRAAETDPACPGTVSGGTRHAVNGRVSVDLTCPKGCQGGATLDSNGRQAGRVWTFHLKPGTSPIVFSLDAAARRTLRRTGKLDATVSVHTQDLNGDAREATAQVRVRA